MRLWQIGLVVLIASPVPYVDANPTFYTGIGTDLTARNSFLGSLLGPVHLITDFPGNTDVLTAGTNTVDVNLIGNGWTADSLQYLAQGTLLSGEVASSFLYNKSTTWGGIIEFVFDTPVEGFAVWVSHDGQPENQRFRMSVTEQGGQTSFSPIIDRPNTVGRAVEGFLGARSSLGLTRVTIEQLGATTDVVHNWEFGLDGVRIGSAVAVPAPGAVLLGMIGLALVNPAKRRAG